MIAVIGIDHYHHWPPLSNAVRDATGAAALFRWLGFEEISAPLLDERATGTAIQSLVTDDLTVLGADDSLVLFYAGHGGTRKHRLGDEVIKAGYLIPVDASNSPDKASSWIDLEGWLRAVSLLPAKHILVILDACHSGIALDPIVKWRDIGTWQGAPLATLQARRSRRIITSALDDQVALDGGPVYGHSLFAGCLMEGLTDGIGRGGGRVTTGSELGLYVQRRVQTYPHSRQTPDFGTFAFDDRGEMVIPLVVEPFPRDGEPGRLEPFPRDEPTRLEALLQDDESTNVWVLGNAVSLGPASEPPELSPTKTVLRPPPVPRASTRPPPNLSRRIFVPSSDNAVSRGPTSEPAEPGSAKTVSSFPPVPYAAMRPPPSPPRRIPRPLANKSGSLGLASEPAEPGSAEAVSGLSSARRRDPVWRWVFFGALITASTVLAVAMLAFAVHGDPPESPVDAPPSKAAGPPPGGCPPGMVRVPAGTFRMGSPEKVGDDDEHPEHEVTLVAYCIDKTEVTVNAYAACVAAKGCSVPSLTVSWSGIAAEDAKRYSQFCNRDDRPDYPINCVDWNQATAYCAWAGKRLPTEAEWEYAARGNDGRTYPWGNEAPSARLLNACGSECVAMAKRELNLDWKSMYEASDDWETMAPVGSFLEGASPFGVLDMAGNVWEWTADWYGRYTAVATANPRGAKRGTFRVLRGGAWVSDVAGHVRAALRLGLDPTVRDDNVGFRCARRG
ncbi:MAG TPA: SUMF1/EgtB/PvdO family nonheme iron enzyme [Kofleriaceae bacterium]